MQTVIHSVELAAGRAILHRRDQRMLFLFFLVASGASFPFTYISVSYEAIALGALSFFFLYRLLKKSIILDGFIVNVIMVVVLCNIYQICKVVLVDESISIRHVFRGVYGLNAFLLALITFYSGFGGGDNIVQTGNKVLRILAALVLLSGITGLKLYATGFEVEAADATLGERIVSGNFRIITYYTSFIIFLLFYNLAAYMRSSSCGQLLHSVLAMALVFLTGSRSLIAPCLLVSLLLFMRTDGVMRVLFAGLVMGSIALGVVTARPDVADAYLARFEVASYVDAWRALEQHLAYAAFIDHPIVGLSLGVPYTNLMSALAGALAGLGGYADNADYDLHNEYLWHLLYFGVVGSGLIATMIVVIALRAWRRCGDRPQGKALICYLLVMLVVMYYSSSFIRGYGGMWLGIIIGICLHRIRRKANYVEVGGGGKAACRGACSTLPLPH